MKLTVQYAGLTDLGRVRQTNEDNWTANPEQGLFIVADGMGGEFAGALASKAVVATLFQLKPQMGLTGVKGFQKHKHESFSNELPRLL